MLARPTKWESEEDNQKPRKNTKRGSEREKDKRLKNPKKGG